MGDDRTESQVELTKFKLDCVSSETYLADGRYDEPYFKNEGFGFENVALTKFQFSWEVLQLPMKYILCSKYSHDELSRSSLPYIDW